LWTKIVADSFGLPVSRPSEPEAAALGAALQAAAVAEGSKVGDYVSATAGEVERAGASSSGSGADAPSSSSSSVTEPDLSKRESYDDAFARHQNLGEALFGEEGGVAKRMFLG
jgi:sugar (pentulose or hexulose) kinase